MKGVNNETNFGDNLIEDNNQSSRIPGPSKQGGPGPAAQGGLQEQIHIDPHDYDLSAAGHPFCCIFTFVFKVSAFIMYSLEYPVTSSSATSSAWSPPSSSSPSWAQSTSGWSRMSLAGCSWACAGGATSMSGARKYGGSSPMTDSTRLTVLMPPSSGPASL